MAFRVSIPTPQMHIEKAIVRFQLLLLHSRTPLDKPWGWQVHEGGGEGGEVRSQRGD